MKIDKAEYPDEIADTWLGFLEGDGINRKDWPFVRWMIEEHIIPKAQEDYEMNEVFGGVYVAPTPGTAGAAGTAMNGILKIQNDLVTAGRIAPIVTGALPVTDLEVVNYVENFVTKVPTAYRKVIDILCLNEDWELKYRRGKRVKYNSQYLQEPNLETLADFPNVKVVGLPSHAGSNRIWASLPQARVRPIKKAALAQTMAIENVDRQVKMYTDWSEAVGFTVPEFVFINDQALAA
jgi:hypothetical protein